MYMKPNPKDMIEELKKRKALCQRVMEIINKAIQQSLQPQEVWIQEKERTEKAIKEIDKSLDIFQKLAKRMGE